MSKAYEADLARTSEPVRVTSTIGVFERSLWAARAVASLRPFIEQRGLPLPPKVVVSVGSTTAPNILGECWTPSAATDDKPVITLSTRLDDDVAVLSVLLHELVHAADPGLDGHGRWFVGWASHLGLVGPWRSTCAGPMLRRRLQLAATRLGPYPPAHTGYVVADEGRVVV